MQLLACVVALFICNFNNVWATRSETQCLEYYQTGNDFDLHSLTTKRWHVVYLWPASPRQRENCEIINFKKLSRAEIDATFIGCSKVVPSEGTVVQATYINTAGKLTSVTYYGEEEIKSLFRSCDRIYKYIFIQINETYVMGINCSSLGRGILLSSILPTREQVENVVSNIDIMKGRDGKPDCKLA